ncbi:MAG: cytochrome c3 family protein, partial [Candidatus Zixiibacteriota bacterium]
GLKTECRLCHTTERWKPSTFNHDLQSTYRLEGAHRRVPCTGCHKPTDVDGSALVRYKPTPRTCQECHGGTIAPLEEAG